MKINGIWSEEEVKTLFKFVEIKKSEGVPLIKIFKLFADKVGRMQNSVRNYYYKEVSNLEKDNERCKSLGIQINNHKVLSVVPFSKTDSNTLLNNVDNLIQNGNSVRKACLILSDGDATKMIRIQNKYRALKKETQNKQISNVIKMPLQNNILKEEDVNALFLGLVKLVKKQEYEKAKIMYEHDVYTANQKLKDAIAGLVEKDSKIDELKKQISILKNQTSTLKQKIENLKNSNEEKKTANSLLKEYFYNDNKMNKAITKP